MNHTILNTLAFLNRKRVLVAIISVTILLFAGVIYFTEFNQ